MSNFFQNKIYELILLLKSTINASNLLIFINKIPINV